MSLIMEQMEPKHPEIIVLEFRKIAESDFVYTLASTNINQLAPNCDHKISDGIDYGFNWTRIVLSYFPLNLQKLLNLTLFTP